MIYRWNKTKVYAKNERFIPSLGLNVVDLKPIDGEYFPKDSFISNNCIPKSLLRLV